VEDRGKTHCQVLSKIRLSMTLSRSADTISTSRDVAGGTALLRAVRNQRLEAVKVLLQMGANQKSRSVSGDTPAKLAEKLGGPIAALFVGQ
jgi:ankyrin repeat protein